MVKFIVWCEFCWVTGLVLLLLDVHQFLCTARFVRCSLASEDLKEVVCLL